MANRNDTKGARLVEGVRGDYLGSPRRLHPEIGELEYDASSTRRGRKTSKARLAEGKSYNSSQKFKEDKGETVNLAQQYGLPPSIVGNLGCGCRTAHLTGATAPVGSHIEADYMCDVGYHNYVYFELIGFENKGENSIELDANGDLVETAKTEARELSEF